MDVVRLMRRFPDEALRRIADDAVRAVTDTGLLQHWVETKRVQAVGYWVEAIYQLCTMGPAPEYLAHLAEAMLAAEDLGIGLPATLLGGDAEVTPPALQVPCPSRHDARLRVANLGRGWRAGTGGRHPTAEAIALIGDAPVFRACRAQPQRAPRKGWKAVGPPCCCHAPGKSNRTPAPSCRIAHASVPGKTVGIADDWQSVAPASRPSPLSR